MVQQTPSSVRKPDAKNTLYKPHQQSRISRLLEDPSAAPYNIQVFNPD